MSSPVSPEDQFCNAFMIVSGHVINIITKEPGGYLCDLTAGQVVVFEEEVRDFPASNLRQQREMVDTIMSRIRR
jgi:hypothetical protein